MDKYLVNTFIAIFYYIYISKQFLLTNFELDLKSFIQD